MDTLTQNDPNLSRALPGLGAEVVLVDERTFAPYTQPARTNGLPAVRYTLRGEHTTAPLPLAYQVSVGTEPFRHFFAHAEPFDYIFHLAAHAYAAGSVQAPMADFRANLLATLELLEQMREHNAHSRLVFASSAAVYGDPGRLPIDEDTPTVPVSPYGVSKLAAERYLDVYARLYGLQAASLRLFSVYGPHQAKQVVYDLYTKLHASPHRLVVLGDGSQERDMVYVQDVVQAFLVVAAQGSLDGSVYNVATGASVSTAELARLIIESQQADAEIAFTGQTRPGDPERWLGSSTRLEALGWAPRFSLREGLRETAAWFNATEAAPVGEAGAR
jgi:UDP-glucose 4-epimerase